MKRLFIDYNPLYVRVALSENGELVEYYVERSSIQGFVGNIYKGQVTNVLPGMKAAFVNIGRKKNGFLYVGESLVDKHGVTSRKKEEKKSLNISAGDFVMCQVVKDEFGDKGANLTMEVSVAGRMLVMVPNSSFVGVSRKIEDSVRREYLEDLVKANAEDNTGYIVRTSASKADDEDIVKEMNELKEVWARVQENYNKAPEKGVIFKEANLLWRAIRDMLYDDIDEVLVNDEQIFEELSGKVGKAKLELYQGEENILTHFRLIKTIQKLGDRTVRMKNGAYIVIDKTEALTVIDVNTGKFVGGKDLEDTIFKTNLTAADEIAKQLRLRNIGGIVIIDFIDMTIQQHKDDVLERLKEALKKDKMKTTVVQFTSLGLVELTRKKSRLPIDTYLLRECPHCKHGFLMSFENNILCLREKITEKMMRERPQNLLVEVNSELADKIFESRLLSKECMTIWKGKRIYILKNDSLFVENYILTANNDKVLTLPNDARLLF